MSIEKFSDPLNMSRPPVATDRPLEERIAAAWDRAHLRGRLPLPGGVMRFRSIEEAQKARAEHTRNRLRKLRE